MGLQLKIHRMGRSCDKWNSGKFCSNATCRIDHVCSKCGRDHQAVKCNRKGVFRPYSTHCTGDAPGNKEVTGPGSYVKNNFS